MKKKNINNIKKIEFITVVLSIVASIVSFLYFENKSSDKMSEEITAKEYQMIDREIEKGSNFRVPNELFRDHKITMEELETIRNLLNKRDK